MPPEKAPKRHCNQFHKLVERTKEPGVKKYVEKACWAFCDGHLEAAVLLAWCGVERYCSLLIEDIGKWYFDLRYRVSQPSRRVPKYYTVYSLNELATSTRLLIGYYQRLEELANLRNDLAHGTGRFMSESEAILKKIRSASFLFQSLVRDENLNEPERLADHNGILHESFPTQTYHIENLLRHFPNNTDWTKVFAKLQESFWSKLTNMQEEINRKLNEGTYDSKSIERSQNDAFDVRDKMISKMKSFAQVAFEKLSKTEKRKIYNSFIDAYLLKIENLDDEDEESSLLPDAIRVFNIFPYPLNTRSTKRRNEFLEIFIDTLEQQLQEFLHQIEGSLDTVHRQEMERLFRPIKDVIRDANRQIPRVFQKRWQKVFQQYKQINGLISNEEGDET